MGIVLEDTDSEDKYFTPEKIKLANETLVPGEYTNLTNLYLEPIKYVGTYKIKGSTFLIFYLGNDHNLFGNTRYYASWLFLNPFKIANKYTDTSMRDLNFIDNRWK